MDVLSLDMIKLAAEFGFSPPLLLLLVMIWQNQKALKAVEAIAIKHDKRLAIIETVCSCVEYDADK